MLNSIRNLVLFIFLTWKTSILPKFYSVALLLSPLLWFVDFFSFNSVFQEKHFFVFFRQFRVKIKAPRVDQKWNRKKCRDWNKRIEIMRRMKNWEGVPIWSYVVSIGSIYCSSKYFKLIKAQGRDRFLANLHY